MNEEINIGELIKELLKAKDEVIDFLCEQLELRTQLTKEEWKRIGWDAWEDREWKK